MCIRDRLKSKEKNHKAVAENFKKLNDLVRYSTYSKRLQLNKSLSSPQSERIVNMLMEMRQCLKKVADYEEFLKSGKTQTSSAAQTEGQLKDCSLLTEQAASTSIKTILLKEDTMNPLGIFIKAKPKEDYTESNQKETYKKGRLTRKFNSYWN
eukprot:TRINITY_DN10283_c0_g1_i2.p1 TRINITY_DN10283_c0_g1~~TRINITY_DN10283_c0_g1_i2.p1  ORF type:complete len:153 (-),score=25.77 TRINITY_DN10283_c0_g1_i2:122-580(-)